MRPLPLLVILFLCGCATPGDPEKQNRTASASRIHCDREVPTGSHRSIITCRSEEQRKQDREDAQRVLTRPAVRQPPL
ncbi:uncharacterized protein METZ01_LOCUS508427 [marine metagenome]|uniref:Lipoprotein n=1 Tax=marine metagenome TaxID=408172 RepID=A0A383EGM5_9ZZZZ